jgi:hypothetical protein
MSDAPSDVAVMADDCTASILESLHQRVMRLEDVWKVGYNIAEFKKPFELSLSRQVDLSQLSPLNKLFPALRSTMGFVGDIWVNPLSGLGKVTKVEILKELKIRDVSNGISCLLIVCLAKVNNMNVVLKFRMIDSGSGDSTEIEAKNALGVEFDSKLDGMFPKLYCVFKITTLIPGDVNRTWECIGIQELEDLSNEDMRTPIILCECFRLLRNLHACGYAHGDAHIGNFMKSSEGEVTKVYMIDQDEIRLLPASDIGVSNYLQSLDYQTLLFQGMPLCDIFLRILNAYPKNQGKALGYLQSVIKGVFWKVGYLSVIVSPVSHIDYKGYSVEDIRQRFSTPDVVLGGKTYYQFLCGVDRKYIDNKFASLFYDQSFMKEFNKMMIDEWKFQRRANKEPPLDD